MVTPYYSDDLVTLYHGDALELLADLSVLEDETVDAVITDPPYVIGAVSAGNMASKSGGWADMMNSALWFTAWYAHCNRLLKVDGSMWSFCNWRTLPVVMRAAIDARMPITSLMVWDKEWIGPGGPKGLRPRYELCALMAQPDFAVPNRGTPDIWPHKVGSYKPHGHPAEKPEGLIRRIITTAAVPAEGLVLDPFSGSGTTAAAAAAEGIRCVAFEADERWCEVAAKRIQLARTQPELSA